MKKGITFSIITFLFLIPILSFVISYSTSMQSIRRESIQRILSDQIIFFSKVLKDDLEKTVWISGKRAAISLMQEVIRTGMPTNDSVGAIKELIENGTLNGEIEILMQNNTINSWIDLIKSEQSASNFNFNISYLNLTIGWQNFEILLQIAFSINVSDLSNTTRLSRISNTSIGVSIENLEDPIYPLYTNGLVRRSIKICNSSLPEVISLATGTIASGNTSGNAVIALSSNISYIQSIENKSEKILVTDNLSTVGTSLSNQFKGLVSDTADIPIGLTKPYIVNTTNATTSIPNQILIYLDEITKKVWNIDNLETTIRTGCYHLSLNGSNFLGRLEGNLTISGNLTGIESFVDVSELMLIEIPIKENQSVIDYLYFSNNTYLGCKVRGINETWFRIDSWNANRYGVSELLDCS
jgi:phosphohistidine swiveling domain-containing protein